MARIDASVIVPVWDAPGMLRQTLDSFIEHHRGTRLSVELVLADNGSAPPAVGVLDAVDWPRVRRVTNATNLGFPRAANQGAAVASGRALVFLNSDVTSSGAWLEALVDHAGRLCVGQAGPDLMRWPSRLTGLRTPYVSAWCMAIQRDLFERIGGFDEAFSPGYSEDQDLGYRLYLAGYDLVRVALPVHHVRGGSGRRRDFDRDGAIAHGRAVFDAKWGTVCPGQELAP